MTDRIQAKSRDNVRVPALNRRSSVPLLQVYFPTSSLQRQVGSAQRLRRGFTAYALRG